MGSSLFKSAERLATSLATVATANGSLTRVVPTLLAGQYLLSSWLSQSRGRPFPVMSKAASFHSLSSGYIL